MPPLAPFSSPILDSFNRADEGPQPTGWTAWLSTGLKIVSNQCAPNDGTDNGGFWNGPMFGPDVEAYVTIATLPVDGGDTGVLVRGRPTGPGFNGSYYGVHHSPAAGTDSVFVEWFDSALGGAVTLATYSQDLSAGDKLGIRCIGSVIEAWVYTSGAWAKLGSVVDTNIAGVGANNRFGLYIYGNGGTGARYDDFGGGVLYPLKWSAHAARRKKHHKVAA